MKKSSVFLFAPLAVILLSMFLSIPVFSFAQQYPTKPISMISMGAPGGTGDSITRMLTGKAEKLLGQPIEIMNNNVGGGAVAFGLLGRAKPDGYTLAATAGPLLTWVPFVRQVSYKLEDYDPVMVFALQSSGLIVKSDSSWKTFKEFLTYAKQNPNKVTYAVTSAGTPMDLAMQYVAKQEGISWTAVPTPGGDPNTMLLGGHVTAVSGTNSWLPYVKSGAVHLLAVHNATRMKEFPDVPTFKELGYDFVHATECLILAPKGTPEPLLQKLDDVFHDSMKSKEFLDFVEKFGYAIVYIGHKELPKYLADSRDTAGKVIKSLGIAQLPEKK